MPLYVIERKYADQLDLSSDGVKALEEINADEGVRWLFSFLSADRRQSYCLYEAPSPDEIVAAARRPPGRRDRRGESHLARDGGLSREAVAPGCFVPVVPYRSCTTTGNPPRGEIVGICRIES